MADYLQQQGPGLPGGASGSRVDRWQITCSSRVQGCQVELQDPGLTDGRLFAATGSFTTATATGTLATPALVLAAGTHCSCIRVHAARSVPCSVCSAEESRAADSYTILAAGADLKTGGGLTVTAAR